MDTETILLAKDSTGTAELLVRVLGMSIIKSEVVIARNGVEALDCLFGSGECAERDTNRMPELVMPDLNMPRMDGLGTLRCIRKDKRIEPCPS